MVYVQKKNTKNPNLERVFSVIRNQEVKKFRIRLNSKWTENKMWTNELLIEFTYKNGKSQTYKFKEENLELYTLGLLRYYYNKLEELGLTLSRGRVEFWDRDMWLDKIKEATFYLG